jgi:hypothetical protein
MVAAFSVCRHGPGVLLRGVAHRAEHVRGPVRLHDVDLVAAAELLITADGAGQLVLLTRELAEFGLDLGPLGVLRGVGEDWLVHRERDVGYGVHG